MNGEMTDDEDGKRWWRQRMVKTADNDENGEQWRWWMMNSFVANGYWCLFLVLCCLFTRTLYRVFILWCEYPMRLLPFRVYKGNEKMGMRKMMTWQGNILKYKGSERTVREQAHKNEETTWKHTVVQREQMDGVASRCRLLSQIGAFLRYLLLQVTSTHHHHYLFDHCNCVTLSVVMGVVSSDSKSMSWMGWPDVDVCQRQRRRRWKEVELTKWYQQ
jgi:hypothetical protein